MSKYLVPPEKVVASSVLETVPDIQELGDPMRPDVICVVFGVIPGQRRPERQETH